MSVTYIDVAKASSDLSIFAPVYYLNENNLGPLESQEEFKQFLGQVSYMIIEYKIDAILPPNAP